MPPYSDTVDLARCPVCGREPRLTVYPAGDTGYDCEVKCKPFMRKEHLSVCVYRSREQRAITQAVEKWNYACAQYHKKDD